MRKDNFYTVTEGMRGWFAVEFWWNPWNPEGFYEPYQSDFMSFSSKEEAVKRAKALADDEEILYKD